MATINGTSFADNLVGTAGTDTINGRAGDDVIRGGGGRDTISLGSGHDTVVYTAVTDSPFTSNSDRITDFAQGDDRIDLTALLGATDLTWGGLSATANGVWYSRSGTTVSIFVDTDGVPGTPEMRIDLQNMSTTAVLTASDFLGVVMPTSTAPVFGSQANWTVPENGTAIGTVVATDPDSPTVSYSLVNGVDSARVSIDPTTGVLSFVTAPNFEMPADVGADNVYNFTVQASDGVMNTTQAVTVTVTNVNEAAPVITSPAAFSIAENSTAVGTVIATDADSPTVTYSLTTGGDAARFTINATTGALSFVNAPDFEAPADANADNVYNLGVQASDGTLNTTQALSVTVSNVVNETLTGNAAANILAGAAGNDIITGNAGADTLTGNGGNDTFVYASAQDSLANTNWQTPPDASVPRVWDAITDFTQGADKIDLSALLGATDLNWGGTTPTGNAVWYVNSGTQTFIYADIDNNPPPDVMIALQNRGSLTLTANDFIGVVGGFTGGAAVAPVFTSPAAFSIAENSTAVGTVAATDADSPTVTYSLVNGVDSARFAINATTGALSFVTAPNFEAPTDAGANNVYNFTVQASDGTLNTTQAVAVTVTDVNETPTGAAPVFTSPAAFSIAENSTTVGTVIATDADSPTVTYSLITGVDSARFAINATTGALSFVTAPNFEAPADAGADNVYNFTVQASDGTLNTTQAVAVTVTDVAIEAIAGTAGNDTLVGTAGADLIDISAGGNDTVTAGSGTDTILAGAAFNAADRIDGGTEVDDTNETDTLVLDGNYAAGVVFAATTLVNVEEIHLTAGNSYNLTTSNATVVGASLSIDGSALLAADTMTVNASAETEAGASYTMTGGAGNDVFTGGAGPDYFDISFGGNDIVAGGAGRDTIYAGSALTAADQVNGGAGTDFVYLNGNYSTGLTLGATTLTGIEAIVVQAGNNYSLTMNNAMLTGTQAATVDGFALASGNTLTVNASAEADSGTVYTLSGGAGNDVLTGGAGNDLLNGNAGNDILVGGAGNDILTGGAGNDMMTGGLGNDVFDFNAIAERGTTGDTITDFSRSGANGVDVLNLHDLLQTFTGFNGSNAFSGGYLQFDTSSGTSTTVRVDTSGGANSYVALVTLTGTLLQQTDTANYVI
jgi:Ca2+-binding RTX toxin-like protein